MRSALRLGPDSKTAMAIFVEKTEFDPEEGYEYYVRFARNGAVDENAVKVRVPVEVAVSIGENGELADLSFEIPKTCRSREAVLPLRDQPNAQYVDPRLFVVFPGFHGDTVALAAGRLELDTVGRIIALEILWNPTTQD